GPDTGWSIPSASTRSSASSTNWEDLGLEQSLAATASVSWLWERRSEARFADAPADRLVALGLLAGLDEAGYLTTPPEAVADRLGAPPAGGRRGVLRRPGP